MLTPIIETRVTGEAEVMQLFEISAGSKNEKKVAGCRVFNGIISRSEVCRVTRNGKIIFTGMFFLRFFPYDVQEFWIRSDILRTMSSRFARTWSVDYHLLNLRS